MCLCIIHLILPQLRRFLLLRELVSEGAILTFRTPSEQYPNGRQLSPQLIDKIVSKFGLNPETVFEEAQPMQQEEGAEGMPPQGGQLA